MTLFTRRKVLIGLGAAGATLLAGRILAPRILAVPDPRPLDPDLEEWVAGLWQGIDRTRAWDVHVHVVGTGAGGTGCRVGSRVTSHLRPIARAQFEIYLAASGVLDMEQADGQYLLRLLRCHRLANPDGRLVVLAMDEPLGPGGEPRPDEAAYVTPNEYVLDLAREHPDLEAGVSIHPWREDAVPRLERAAARGARLVKWLPASMGIDPSDPRCDAFYEALARLRLPLLTHAGAEMAVPADARGEWGNPLRLRRALERGVRVVVAHCAGLGDDEDLDVPQEPRPRRPSHELFLRMMRERAWEQQLFGDISAVTQVNRCGAPLRDLLAAEDLHHRLLNGSDYPLPAIDPVISTWLLHQRGYLSDDEHRACNRVYAANPLLFDFCVKRCLALRDGGGRRRFSPAVFETSWLFA